MNKVEALATPRIAGASLGPALFTAPYRRCGWSSRSNSETAPFEGLCPTNVSVLAPRRKADINVIDYDRLQLHAQSLEKSKY